MSAAGGRASAWSSLALVAATVGLGACQAEPGEEPPPRPACDPKDAACGLSSGSVSPSGASGSGGSGGSGGVGGGASAGEQVVGNVAVVDAPTFALGSTYAEPATVVAPSAGGGTVASSYGGSFGPTFALEGVEAGFVPFLVQDETGGASGVLSTLSLARVPGDPPGSPFVLPVVDRAMLSALYAGLSAAPILDESRAQVAVRFLRGGFPVEGVRLEAAVSADAVAYDEGFGFFSDAAVATGPAGMVLFANATPSGAGVLTLPVLDAEGDPFVVSVPEQAGAATLADVELPP